MSGFDFNNIPDSVLHDAAQRVLAGCDLNANTKIEYHFRCPLCGDSKKSLHKKRGHVYFAKSVWRYVCYNCGKNMPFISFLKMTDREVYRNVIFHGFSRDAVRQEREDKKEDWAEETYKPLGSSVFKPGELVSIFDDNDLSKIALGICQKRKIRTEVYSRWFVCLKDSKFYNRLPNGEIILNEQGFPTGNEYGYRLIIPYYKYGGVWSQFDARDLRDKSPLRYRNLQGAEREFYNIDWLDVTKPFFLLEGAVDATFIKNAVSFGGIKGFGELIAQHPEILENARNGVVMWDNDDSGKDEIEKTVKMGFNWFNWSDIIPSEEFRFNEDGSERIIKDVNDSVMYTNLMERDDEEYIKLESLVKYVEKPNLIKVNLMFGNRQQAKKEKTRETMKNLEKNNLNSKGSRKNPFLDGLSSGDSLAFLSRR